MDGCRLLVKIIAASFFLQVFVSCIYEESNNLSLQEKKVELGRRLFFDSNLSEPVGQSCATCHRPETGFSDSLNRVVSEGAILGRFGNRNSMTNAYSMFTPPLHYDSINETYVGGFFYDGRVNTLQE